MQQCKVTGYVSNVQLRLFTPWNGSTPLYLFVILLSVEEQCITRRYVVPTPTTSTKWQTIGIPPDALPISAGDFLAVGMHDANSGNQIFMAESTPILKAPVTEHSTSVVSPVTDTNGVAFAYTVAYTGEIIRDAKGRCRTRAFLLFSSDIINKTKESSSTWHGHSLA